MAENFLENLAEEFLSFKELAEKIKNGEIAVSDNEVEAAPDLEKVEEPSLLEPSLPIEKVMADKTLTVEERRKVLSKIAVSTQYSRQFRTNDRMVAIDILNKMDKLYKEEIRVEHEVVHSFNFVLPDGTKFIPGIEPKQLTEGGTQ